MTFPRSHSWYVAEDDLSPGPCLGTTLCLPSSSFHRCSSPSLPAACLRAGLLLFLQGGSQSTLCPAAPPPPSSAMERLTQPGCPCGQGKNLWRGLSCCCKNSTLSLLQHADARITEDAKVRRACAHACAQLRQRTVASASTQTHLNHIPVKSVLGNSSVALSAGHPPPGAETEPPACALRILQAGTASLRQVLRAEERALPGVPRL